MIVLMLSMIIMTNALQYRTKRIHVLMKLYFQSAISSIDILIATAITAVPTPMINIMNHRYRFILIIYCKKSSTMAKSNAQ